METKTKFFWLTTLVIKNEVEEETEVPEDSDDDLEDGGLLAGEDEVSAEGFPMVTEDEQVPEEEEPIL